MPDPYLGRMGRLGSQMLSSFLLFHAPPQWTKYARRVWPNLDGRPPSLSLLTRMEIRHTRSLHQFESHSLRQKLL